MTISAKLSDVGGLEFIVSDPTDTDDINGFSDVQSVVGGESAKFSDTSVMQANSGKIIGLSQVAFEGGLPILNRNIESSVSVTDPANAIDDDIDTLAEFDAPNDELIIDFESLVTGILKWILRATFGSRDIEISKSDDNISYTLIDSFTAPTVKTTRDEGSHTFRYIKIERIGSTGGEINIFQVWVESSPVDTATAELLSTTTQDATSGTTLIGSTVINAASRETPTVKTKITFNSVLLLTGTNQFITLRVVSHDTAFGVPVNLTDITSVKEV